MLSSFLNVASITFACIAFIALLFMFLKSTLGQISVFKDNQIKFGKYEFNFGDVFFFLIALWIATNPMIVTYKKIF